MSKRENGRKRQTRSRAVEPKGQWKLFIMMALCAVIMITGFFFAARQHFSSIDYGIRNSRLRKQLEDLESEKRRLILAREMSVSPGEIKKAAKKFGIGEQSSDDLLLASTAKPAKPASGPVPAGDKASSSTDPSYLVVKTSMSSSVQKPVNAVKAKKDTAERPRQVAASTVATR